MSIALVAIVRDEQAVVRRWLRSVRPLIDRWTIVDTGSTDATRELIRAELDDVPGELHERPWRNFGENLTEALELARGSAEWILRLDADMTVEWHPGLRDWLAEDRLPEIDAWKVEIREHWGFYRLQLLMRGSLEWRYVGVAHEHLAPARSQRALLGLTVHHHHDGSSRGEKFERDRALLEAELERDPTDARSTFYLAQTYRSLGLTEKAIELYERRASMGGWEEEGWYAAYQAAKLSEDVDALLAAHARRPWRHEPLQAAAAIVVRDNRGDSLFVEAV